MASTSLFFQNFNNLQRTTFQYLHFIADHIKTNETLQSLFQQETQIKSWLKNWDNQLISQRQFIPADYRLYFQKLHSCTTILQNLITQHQEKSFLLLQLKKQSARISMTAIAVAEKARKQAALKLVAIEARTIAEEAIAATIQQTQKIPPPLRLSSDNLQALISRRSQNNLYIDTNNANNDDHFTSLRKKYESNSTAPLSWSPTPKTSTSANNTPLKKITTSSSSSSSFSSF